MKISLAVWLIQRGMRGMLPQACWCSMADVIELADLHLLPITFWIGQHYLGDVYDQDTALLHPYRVHRLSDTAAHVALYAGHFYHMRTPPPPVCDTTRAFCTQFDDHLGCDVMPLSVAQQPVCTSTTFIDDPLLGGAKRTRTHI